MLSIFLRLGHGPEAGGVAPSNHYSGQALRQADIAQQAPRLGPQGGLALRGIRLDCSVVILYTAPAPGLVGFATELELTVGTGT